MSQILNIGLGFYFMSKNQVHLCSKSPLSILNNNNCGISRHSHTLLLKVAGVQEQCHSLWKMSLIIYILSSIVPQGLNLMD